MENRKEIMKLRTNIIFLNKDIYAIEGKKRIKESQKAGLDKNKDRVLIRKLQTEIEALDDNIKGLEGNKKKIETQIVMAGSS